MQLLNRILPILVALTAVASAGKPVTPGEPTDENPSPVKVNILWDVKRFPDMEKNMSIGTCYHDASFGGDIQGYTINGPKVKIQNWKGSNFDDEQYSPDWEGPTNRKKVKISPRAIRSYCINEEKGLGDTGQE
ncbi:uncharacterized protein BDV14DRAFT_200917 [Aspergillus stella-maris]|uniref:uncharacterized protein n=1 Tax=Aspergillus stella-maris TaxID=1810926 RepID=UPI003CCD2A1C